MPRGRPIEPVVLTDDEKDQLLSLANSRSLPHGAMFGALQFTTEALERDNNYPIYNSILRFIPLVCTISAFPSRHQIGAT